MFNVARCKDTTQALFFGRAEEPNDTTGLGCLHAQLLNRVLIQHAPPDGFGDDGPEAGKVTPCSSFGDEFRSVRTGFGLQSFPPPAFNPCRIDVRHGHVQRALEDALQAGDVLVGTFQFAASPRQIVVVQERLERDLRGGGLGDAGQPRLDVLRNDLAGDVSRVIWGYVPSRP